MPSAGGLPETLCEAEATHPVIGSAVPVAALGTQRVLVQMPLAQSLGLTHVSAGAHFLVQVAPQSTVGSLPFFTPSLQVGAWQRWVVARHTRLVQSPGSAQPLLSAQGLLQLDPQSTSVSLPFFTPSLQLPAWQVPLEQLALLQSPLLRQCCPVMQRAQPMLPPQSTSLSS